MERTAAPRFWCFGLAGFAAVGLIVLGCMLIAEESGERPSPFAPAANTTLEASRTQRAGERIAPAIAADQTINSARRSAPSPQTHNAGLEERGFALAWTHPAVAFRKLDDFGPPERLEWTRGVFKALSQSDVTWALAYAKQLPQGPERQAALQALLAGWGYPTDETPEQRARRTEAFGADADLGLFLLESGPPQPVLAVLWAKQLASGQGRTQLLGQAAVALAPTDPDAALACGNGLEGDARLAFDAMMVRGWTRQQPDDAWRWSSGLTDPVVREEMQSLSISELSAMDPPAAAGRLSLLPSDDDRIRQAALAEVAANYARQNTEAALAWASTLPANDQKAALDSIHGQASGRTGP